MKEAVEIVLVEDNPDDVELTMTALRENNLANNVKILRDGQEALDYIFENVDCLQWSTCPKVILLDLKLPKIDGLEVLQKIRSD
jgi:two-component system, response regulator